MSSSQSGFSRRQFLRALMGMGGMAALNPRFFIGDARAALPVFNDYKALVYIHLNGGNDSTNMLVPLGSALGTGYDTYAGIRGGLAVSQTELDLSTVAGGVDLNNGKLGYGAANPYHVDGTQQTAYLKGVYSLKSKGIDLGVNAMMPELAQLITDNKASIVANIGPLIRPVTRSQIKGKTAELPKFLFAHDHQSAAIKTARPEQIGATGWSGRIADDWIGVNQSSPMGLNVSFTQNDLMLVGDTTRPLLLNSGSLHTYNMMDPTGNGDHQDRRALFKALAGISGSSSSGAVNFSADKTFSNADPFHRLYSSMLSETMDTFDFLKDVWAQPMSFSRTGSYGEPLFDPVSHTDLGFDSKAWTDLFSQLWAATKVIKLGASGALGPGYHRQVIVINMGWWDNHNKQAREHPKTLRLLSMGLWKFQQALEELGLQNNVITTTISEFGRTMSNNGDGTDHGWGAHHIVMGGDGLNHPGHLNGGKLLGELPDMRLGGVDDYDEKGRIIPTVAQSQVNAALCRWFGVDDVLMQKVFPNLGNFRTGNALDSAFLQNLFV